MPCWTGATSGSLAGVCVATAGGNGVIVVILGTAVVAIGAEGGGKFIL